MSYLNISEHTNILEKEKKMKNLNWKKCDDVVRVEKDVGKVTCSMCCATLGLKKD